MEEGIKIIIEVRGGLIETVWASSEAEVNVTVIDHDVMDDTDPEPDEESTHREKIADLEDLKEAGEVEEVY